MKITNDYFKHSDYSWIHEGDVFYVTDERGVTWELRPAKNGLKVRSLGSTNRGDDSIHIRPECANAVRLYSMRPEES